MCIIVYLSLNIHALGRSVIDVEHLWFPWENDLQMACDYIRYIYLNIYIYAVGCVYIYTHI